jgi:hypothetical protein
VIWDAADSRVDDRILELLAVGQKLAQLIGPWQGKRPPLEPVQARISLLTPSGLHFGQAPLDTLARDPMAAPVVTAARRLMQALIQIADDSGQTG